MTMATTHQALRVLFVETSTPGPLSAFAELLAKRGDEVVILSGKINRAATLPVGARIIGYPSADGFVANSDHFLADMDRALNLATRVAKAALALKGNGWSPELVCGLDDGSALLLGQVFPDCPQLMHLSRYLTNQTAGASSIAEAETALIARLTNTVRLLTSVHASWSLCTTPADRASYPEFLQPRLSVLAPAVDTGYFSPAASPPTTSHPEAADLAGSLADWYSTRSTLPLVTFLARSVAGHERAVAVLAELTRSAKPIAGVIATAYGPEGPGDDGCFRCRPGPPDRRRLARASALVVNVDTDETWPAPLVEAMACGTTVLAVGTAMVAAIVEHGKSGYLTAPNNPVALAELIAWALEHQSEIAVVGRNARTAVQRFGLEETTTTYRRLVDWVVAGGAGPVRPPTFRPPPLR